MRKIFTILLIISIGLMFAGLLEDFYNSLFYEGEGKLFELYNNLNYLEVIKKASDSSDSKSVMLTGLSYMNMLCMEKAVEYFSEVEGKYKKDAEFFKLRSEVILKRDKALANKYLSMLGNSLAERAESAFIRYLVFHEDTVRELKDIFLEAVKENEAGEIGYIDMYAFDYAFVLKDKDIDKAIAVLNKAVTYNFNEDRVEVYYTASDLRQSHFANLALLSLLLQKKAIIEIEKLFGMKLDEFLKLSQVKRDKLINDKLISMEGSKKIKFINYLLTYSISVLVYGKNDYYGLMHLDGKPFIYEGRTIKEEQDFSRKLLGIVKTS